MTYTVKNGIWCKDNENEYYSTTKTGLKAALKAGEISAGTRVVVHEPRQPAGTIIQSLNPNCPEGFMVPDGSAIDPVYEELIAVVGPNLPDIRECVLVMTGHNTHITTHAHDAFSAGEFKDDQAQLVEHDHDITDPGHEHSINDPGHTHGITDPGHYHTTLVDWGGDGNKYHEDSGGRTKGPVDVNSDTKQTGVTINSATTGITANSTVTGITVNAKGNNNVTRTKQFGVYFYIAF